MKKLLLNSMVVVLASQAMYAESQESRLCRLSKNIKSKVEQAKDSTKAFTIATVVYCQDQLHKLREPNYAIIEKANAAMDTLHDVVKAIDLGVHSEIELLQNVQALGYDKKNAAETLRICSDMYYALLAFEKRYNGLLTPWNRSKKMQTIASSALKNLKNAELYKLYFESHQDCLQAWQLYETYQDVLIIDMDNQSTLETMLQGLCHPSDKYFLIHGIEQLEKDLQVVKRFVKDVEYKKTYATMYAQCSELLPKLEQLHTTIKNSIEYKKQIAQQALDPRRG